MTKKRALFVGRYQYLHDGHIWCFKQKIEAGIPVLVCIRDVATDEKNPYTSEQVKEMFETHPITSFWIRIGFMVVMIIPDIESICYGRDVGYKIEELVPPADIAKISATELRKQNTQNEFPKPGN